MTFRAVVLGLLGAVFIATVGYVNRHIGTSELTRGHLPISVFGVLIVMVAIVNPLLFKAWRRLRFRATELAVIVAMTLVACSIPSAGLMRYFTAIVVMPIRQNRIDAGWRKTDALSYAPPSMLVADGKFEETAVGGYFAGMGREGYPIGLEDVPWRQWRGPLATWLPLIVLSAIAVICLSMVVHPQWSRRERLKYPIADFATSLLEETPGRTMGPIFRRRAFWGALCAILAIHIVNGVQAYYPQFIRIPLSFDFAPAFTEKFPTFLATPRAPILVRPMIFPAVVAFSFFLASDISFSLGIAHFLSICAIYLLMQAGVVVSGTYMRGGVVEWHNFGSYLGIGVLLAYLGRRYYWRVLKGGFTGVRDRETEGYAVWACRILLLAAGGMVGWLIYFGLDWPLAILAVFVVLLMFLVIARINAECGLFFYKPPWLMPGILVGLFGTESLGPGALVILSMFAVVVAVDPFECLMPYVTNGLKVTDSVGVGTGRVGVGMSGAFVLALAVAVPVVLWADYNYGIGTHKWVDFAAKAPFDAAAQTVDSLVGTGKLEEVQGYTIWQRLAHMDPKPECLWAIGLGFVLVLICGRMRLRLPWWPLHPVVFLCFGAWLMGKFGFSFLLGWFIKVAVTRLGGQQKYRQAKPLMVGVIAGDLLGGLVFMVVNWVYYAVMGMPGKPYNLW